MLGICRTKRPFSRRSAFFVAAFALCLVPNRSSAQSQDVVEAARQEKARKAPAEKKKTHVYTNEDLHRSKILTEDDQDRVIARKKEQTPPSGSQPADALEAAAPRPPESLGEVARRYHVEKAAREAEQALKPRQHFPFPAELSQPALAAPRPPVVQPGPQPPQPLQPLTPATPAVARGRRDPFSHLPLQPVPPVVPPPTIHGTVISPAPPKPELVSPHPAAAIVPHRLPPTAPMIVAPKAQPSANTLAPPAARVTVQTGDSLWKLARQHLGNGSRWREWLVANPGMHSPYRIRTGAVLLIPAHTGPPRSATAQEARVSVQPGDSLWRIAKARFGSGIAWSCIAQANPELHAPDRISPGQRLLIPSSCCPTPQR